MYSDHECDSFENALEKLRKGQFIMIREGTAAQNLEALMPLLTPRYASRCMFCTDDKHPYDLLHRGHIDAIVRKAIRLGADPILTIKVASHNAARYFLLNNKGAIAPGYLADFAVLDDLERVNVQMLFKRGVCVYDGRTVQAREPEIDPDILSVVSDTFHLPELTPSRLRVGESMPLMGLIPKSIVTRNLGTASGVNPAEDILKLVVCERHHSTGHVGVCYVKGYGLKRGAIAASIAHDSHNIIACGVTDEDICAAVNRIRALRGGITVADGGQVVAELPLPVGGLFTNEPLEKVNEQLENCKRRAYNMGVTEGVDPFMTMSFTSLCVIPSLRLTTQGVFDVDGLTFL